MKHKPEDLIVIPTSVLDDMYRRFGGGIYLYINKTKPLKPLLERYYDGGQECSSEEAKQEFLNQEIELK